MAKKPNILVLVSDEHTPKTLGCYGHPFVRTPHLDALARQGVTFDNAYCNSPLCVPSRLSMLTGLYPWRIGAWDLLSHPPENRLRITDHLKQNGYYTATIGKWHLKSHIPVHHITVRVQCQDPWTGDGQCTPRKVISGCNLRPTQRIRRKTTVVRHLGPSVFVTCLELHG